MMGRTGSRQNRVVAGALLIVIVGLFISALFWAASSLSDQIDENRQLATRLQTLQAIEGADVPSAPRGIRALAFPSDKPSKALSDALRSAAEVEGLDIQLQDEEASDGSVAIAFVATGDSARLLSFIAAIERMQPVVRFASWKIEAVDEGGRFTALAKSAVL